MMGIIVQLAISWLLIWLIEKKNLGVLGFRPTWRRAGDFGLFLLIAVACCFSAFLLRMYFANERWVLNPQYSLNLVLSGAWWHFRSVIYEELIFHGVIFYILIKRLGVWWAILISSVAFGIYHWFSWEVWGNVVMMTYAFILTGLAGSLFGYAYARTYSLYITIALHFGYNFTNFLFSNDPLKNGVFIYVKPVQEVQASYFLYYFIQFFPLISFLVINFILLKKRKQEVG